MTRTKTNPSLSVSVVIPVYNNNGTLDTLISRLESVLRSCCQEWQIILVDDGSVDASWETVKTRANESAGILGVRLSRNFGQHPAIKAGLERASGDCVILMDADMNDVPEEIPVLLDAIEGGADLVLTSTQVQSQSGRGRFSSSRLFHRVFARITRTDDVAGVGTMRAFSRQFTNAVLRYGEKRVVYGPLTMQMGFRRVVVPRNFPSEDNSPHSNYSIRSRIALAADALLAYTSLPYTILLLSGISLSTGAVLYAFAVVVAYAGGVRLPSSGTTIVLLVVLVLGGGILAGIGTIGAYVFRIYGEVLDRPIFLVMDEAGKAKRGN
jgi:glycosyltransferase involved in cell wall biosynthesis